MTAFWYGDIGLRGQQHVGIVVTIDERCATHLIIALGTDHDRAAEHQAIRMTFGKCDGFAGVVIGNQATAVFLYRERQRRSPAALHPFAAGGKIAGAQAVFSVRSVFAVFAIGAVLTVGTVLPILAVRALQSGQVVQVQPRGLPGVPPLQLIAVYPEFRRFAVFAVGAIRAVLTGGTGQDGKRHQILPLATLVTPLYVQIGLLDLDLLAVRAVDTIGTIDAVRTICAVFTVGARRLDAGVGRTDPPVAVFADKGRAAVFSIFSVDTIGAIDTVLAIGAFQRG